MSTPEESAPPTSTTQDRPIDKLASIRERHAKETKQLETKIASLRKSVEKASKAKKREMNSRISDMQSKLQFKHDEEIRKLEDQDQEGQDGISLERLDALSLNDNTATSVPESSSTPPPSAAQKKKKPNKAKLRLQRREAEMQRMRDEAEKEASGQVDMGAVEKEAIRELLGPMKLRVREITADGHCLYNAISNQLNERYNQQVSHQELRQAAASYMREHPDDFIPFLYKDDGDMFTADDFERYCNDIENTPRWGGQLEILALSRVKEVPVHIVQMGAPVLKVNEEDFPGKEPLKLAYHKHLYSLGAHYNSLLDL
ncbi:otu domain-containing protein 6b [Lichtheimia corymbifera JMRC:FSU:9682]|uniref:Otu domain-containing protein 6b n=1 Tax=Lichtheimia corymbifera JMRC:FSU:9682 TaxID=1263082 RepID=A0A068S8N4_9FUNG|nr:otu domain-containing protein 6b [Lichtheimia corymbifera JMRC:FSU:9682]